MPVRSEASRPGVSIQNMTLRTALEDLNRVLNPSVDSYPIVCEDAASIAIYLGLASLYIGSYYYGAKVNKRNTAIVKKYNGPDPLHFYDYFGDRITPQDRRTFNTNKLKVAGAIVPGTIVSLGLMRKLMSHCLPYDEVKRAYTRLADQKTNSESLEIQNVIQRIKKAWNERDIPTIRKLVSDLN